MFWKLVSVQQSYGTILWPRNKFELDWVFIKFRWRLTNWQTPDFKSIDGQLHPNFNIMTFVLPESQETTLSRSVEMLARTSSALFMRRNKGVRRTRHGYPFRPTSYSHLIQLSTSRSSKRESSPAAVFSHIFMYLLRRNAHVFETDAQRTGSHVHLTFSNSSKPPSLWLSISTDEFSDEDECSEAVITRVGAGDDGECY